MNSQKYIKSMVFGSMLGDGWISSTQLKVDGNKYYQGGFSGDAVSLEIMKQDLIKVYGDIGKATIQSRCTNSELYNIVGETSQFIVNTKVTKDFISMGMPIGKRVEIEWKIPNWIMNGNREVKRAFLSGFYASEGYTPAFQKNNKTLKVLGFNFHKRKYLNENAMFLIDQFKHLLDDLKIEYTYNIKEKFTKDDNVVIEFRFCNNHSNTLHVLKLLNLRYAVEKQAAFQSVLEYYTYKDNILKHIQDAMDLAHEGRLTPSEISYLYNISVNTVQNWKSKNRRVAQTPKTILTYTEQRLSLL